MELQESDNTKRTKVSKACDYCKKRKFKCNGIPPCELCLKKGIECSFSIIDRRTIRRKNKKRTVKPKPIEVVGESSSSSSPINKNSNSTIQQSKTLTNINSKFVHKIVKDDNHIDKNTLTILKQKSKLPIRFQPLTIFPLHKVDENENSNISTKTPTPTAETNNELINDTSNQDNMTETSNTITTTRKSILEEEIEKPNVLYDAGGNLRYVGESSPLSFLFECRNIFNKFIGKSSFTSEKDSLEIFDNQEEVLEIVQVALPNRDCMKKILELYHIHINQVCYILDLKYFEKEIIEPIYDNYGDCSISQIALINLVIAVGLLYAERSQDPILKDLESSQMKSSAYFEYGIFLTKKYMSVGKLWITEAFAIASCYYQSKSQRNTGWIMIGTAIRNAQALGLHRKYINESFKNKAYVRHRRKLFKSLYIMDRITSVLLGRPLIIDDYDWDDYDSSDIYELDENGNKINNIYLEAMEQTCKVAKIISKIIRGFYLDGIINPYKAEKLAIELRLFSLNLPENLQIDKVIDYDDKVIDGSKDNKIPLLLIHLSQLYAITLLSRPFFMYVIFFQKKFKLKKKIKTRQEISICNFCKATVKASSLTIQLLYSYINYTRDVLQRVESQGLTHACFMASLIIGLSILYLENYESGIYEGVDSSIQMKLINKSKDVFQFYSSTNPMSSRFLVIINQMQKALMNKYKIDINGEKIKKQSKQPHNVSKSLSQEMKQSQSQQEEQEQQRQRPNEKQQQQQQQQQQQEQERQHQQPSEQQQGSQQHQYLQQQLKPDPSPLFTDQLMPTQTPQGHSFNKDYDEFIDNFGTLLPMATMKQNLTNDNNVMKYFPPTNQNSNGSNNRNVNIGNNIESNFNNGGNFGYNSSIIQQQQQQQSQQGQGQAQPYQQQQPRLPQQTQPQLPPPQQQSQQQQQQQQYNPLKYQEYPQNFQQMYRDNSISSSTSEVLDEFMYNIGLNEVLYDAKV
ncbi:uncharacterized protein KGF55_003214 [Candida pseudojiufengensis]|uniref:uncharacterized protein n=1 Tax=Candida pseudojiufengensis TaxID=497109 RepID=UPI002225A3CC|nr:uncharacterized protein KGF55_003214 [Candida pseudojiufengensis]KAI5962138.1 hypothetical protein KGF55_003214 [Candida pseudojiufengensis]